MLPGTNRLVYQPKAYVFTKSQDGTLYNLSPYVTSGEIDREINQVSSAVVTLRNPYRIFTTPKKGVIFHPQDPITIWLERVQGYPVRVFTGYLDNTPYYQLQPSTITLQASCTLKRLLYTFFDPSLPFITSFLSKYGWINTGTGTVISDQAETTKKVGKNQSQASQGGNQLQDGSISKLLWAILYDFGQWDDSNIWIEPIPQEIVTRMQSLMSSMQPTQEASAQLFTGFINDVVGTGGHGSGGGSAGGASRKPNGSGGSGGGTFTGGQLQSVSGLSVKGQPMTDGTNGTPNQLKWANMILKIGHQLGATPAGISVVMIQAIAEGDLTPSDWSPPYGGLLGGNQSYYGSLGTFDSDAVNMAEINAAFQANGTKGYQYQGDLIHLASSQNLLSVAEQNSGSGSQYAGEVGVQNFASEAQAIVAKSQASVTNDTTSDSSKKGGGKKSQHGATATAASAGQTTVYDCIVMAANGLASSGLSYDLVHYGSLAKLWPTYDCSGSVSLVLYAAGLIGANDAFDTPDEGVALTGFGAKSGIDHSDGAVNIYVNPNPGSTGHTFMEIGGDSGRYWGTSDGSVHAPGAGAWLSNGTAAPFDTSDSTFLHYYIPKSILMKPANYHQTSGLTAGGTDIPTTGFGGTKGSGAATSAGGSSSSTSGTGEGNSTATSTSVDQLQNNDSAEAFTTAIDFPSIEDQVTAVVLGSEGKGLMHDQNLLPFVQQVAQSSLRSFQSLPNGDFYAFYPDYFGEFGHRQPYWLIDDIEILSGTINLTDDALATHVYAIGDNTMIDILGGSSGNSELINEMFSAGAISIFNAFLDSSQPNTNDPQHAHSADTEGPNSLATIMSNQEATDFIKRFGARPLVQNYPQIRSSLFEMLMAYQQFMMAWSNQFVSPFTFTFMPELYPGGKVGFPNHGLQMYITQVTHTWDYEEGFTTTAQLTAPSLLLNGESNPDLPSDMITAIAEPVKKNRPNTNANKVNGSATQQPPRAKPVDVNQTSNFEPTQVNHTPPGTS